MRLLPAAGHSCSANFACLLPPPHPPTPPCAPQSGGSKPATLETGAVIQVPLFIQQGERIKVDTRTDSYLSRAQ